MALSRYRSRAIDHAHRTKAERSLDRWNESVRRLRAISDPTSKDLRELRNAERRATVARTALWQMRGGER